MNEDEEIYDVVDSDNRVIGRATRREIHAQSLQHRSVHILVHDPPGRLFLQKRSAAKDENPGFWDTSAAGHLDAGEDYLQAGRRELEEELGITDSPLVPVMHIPASRETGWEHVCVYSCETRQTIRINRREISEGRFWTLAEIRDALDQKDLPFTPTFRVIFNNYLKNKI